MDPLMYPSIIKHGRQLDFHSFSDSVVPAVFGYPPVRDQRFPSLHEDILRSYKLLHGEHLSALTDSMMGNLMMVFRQDHLGAEPGWRVTDMYEFCSSIMFEATFLTLYGRPQDARRHSGMDALREDLFRFDSWFPLLIAKVPIGLLREAKTSRDKLINFFLPSRKKWSNMAEFIRRRWELLESAGALADVDKAGSGRFSASQFQSVISLMFLVTGPLVLTC